MVDQPAQPSEEPESRSEAAPRYPGKGFRLGEYVIIDTLGHGSMATVFLAKDGTGHEIAIKIFQEGPGVSPTLLERFKREAEASKKLRKHPNIMKVYATGKEGPFHYIVMEPVRNSTTFEDYVEVNSLTQDDIVRIIIKIARALHYCHSRNVVHRDVKPTNIMIDEFGEPLLTDFGVAALTDMSSFTMSGALTGTPLYMSPEQARAERVRPPSDIYSLGVVLYEALTGVMPYSTQHSAPVKNVLEAVKNEQPRRPRFYRKEISPDLEAVILKALEKDPDDRYADGESFASDLERAITGRHVSAQLFSNWGHVTSFVRRHDQMIAALTEAIVLVCLSAYFFNRQLLKERYEKLLNIAQLRNFASRLMSDQNSDEGTSQTPGAWHDIRMGRRNMGAESWNAAIKDLESAINFSRATGDGRTTAIAQLDLARCYILTGDFDGAARLYKAILENPDASPAIADFAQLEALMLTLVRNNKAEAMKILGARPIPLEGPIHDAIYCLAGEVNVNWLLDRAANAPKRFRNDLHLAAAIRHRMDGNEKGFQNELRRCAQMASPSSDWPSPLAKYLRESLTR